MPIVERFAHKQGTTLGIQVQPLSTGDPIVTLSIQDLVMRAGNVASEINADLVVEVNGVNYALHLSFADEALDAKTRQGELKTETQRL